MRDRGFGPPRSPFSSADSEYRTERRRTHSSEASGTDSEAVPGSTQFKIRTRSSYASSGSRLR
eukprot:9802156-Alexandrium_andersonii.AAC.1